MQRLADVIATVAHSDAPALLYFSNETLEKGGYEIYNTQKDTRYPYWTIMFSKNSAHVGQR